MEIKNTEKIHGVEFSFIIEKGWFAKLLPWFFNVKPTFITISFLEGAIKVNSSDKRILKNSSMEIKPNSSVLLTPVMPKALTRIVMFQNKLMSNKQKIDLLINEMAFVIKDIKTLPLSRGLKVYVLKGPGKSGYSFNRVSEQKYIDQLLKSKGIVYDPNSKVKSQ